MLLTQYSVMQTSLNSQNITPYQRKSEDRCEFNQKRVNTSAAVCLQEFLQNTEDLSYISISTQSCAMGRKMVSRTLTMTVKI